MYLFCRDNVASPHTCHKPRARLRCSEIKIGQPASVSIARLNRHPSYTTTTENPTNTEFTMTCNGATRKREERTNPRESSSYAAFWLASNIPRLPPASVAFLVKLAAHAKQILEKIIIGQRSVSTTTSFQRKTELTVLIVIHALFRWQLFRAKFLSRTYISYVIFVSSSYFCLENKRLCSWSFSLKVTSSFLKIDK